MNSTRKVTRCVKRNPLKSLHVMAKLNPYVKALKVIRKKELADRLKAKSEKIQKAKEGHKLRREAKLKRKASGGLQKTNKKVAAK